MRHVKKPKSKKIVTWTAALALGAALLSVNGTYGRMIEWTSAELVRAPAPPNAYSSDCMTPDGQNIVLTDWQADETQRTVTIAVRVPQAAQPSASETAGESSSAASAPETTGSSAGAASASSQAAASSAAPSSSASDSSASDTTSSASSENASSISSSAASSASSETASSSSNAVPSSSSEAASSSSSNAESSSYSEASSASSENASSVSSSAASSASESASDAGSDTTPASSSTSASEPSDASSRSNAAASSDTASSSPSDQAVPAATAAENFSAGGWRVTFVDLTGSTGADPARSDASSSAFAGGSASDSANVSMSEASAASSSGSSDTASSGGSSSGPAAGSAPVSSESASASSPDGTGTQGLDISQLTVTPDAAAAAHLDCSVQTEGQTIQLLLARKANAPGLSAAQTMTVHLAWQGLQGTVCVTMLPYGDIAAQTVADSGAADTAQREIVTGLTLFEANEAMDPETPVTALKLNVKTLSDFTLCFVNEGRSQSMVRYSLDGGKSYSLLYDSSMLPITWPYPDDWDGTVFLDFSHALAAGQLPTVEIMATGYGAQTFTPTKKALPAAADAVAKTNELPHTVSIEPVWGSAVLKTGGIQRLAMDADGEWGYQDDTSLTAAVTDGGIRLSAAQEGVLPAAGSYRVAVQWIWNKIPVREQYIYFFVNAK